MAVLYRKYRPKTFSEVVGQEHITRTLKHALVTKHVAHAYLFTGSRGLGKTTIARVLARALNCTNSTDGEACLTCNVCKAFDNGTFLDMVEIDAASNTGVDNVRELIEHVRFQPSQGVYKVFIIDETHMLSKAAFNALLKTLEEPPAHAIFILATTELAKVPATIVSRTQRFDFRRFSTEVIEKHLRFVIEKEKIKLSLETLPLIAKAAAGGLRDALSLLGKVASLPGATVAEVGLLLGITDREYAQQLFLAISKGSTRDVKLFFDRASEAGVDMAALNKDFLEYVRSILLYKIDSSINSNSWDATEVTAIEQCSVPDIIYVIRVFLRSLKDMQSASDELPVLLASLEAALRFERPLGNTGTALPQDHIASTPIVASAPSPATVHTKTEGVTTKEELGDETVNGALIAKDTLLLAWPAIADYIKTVNGPLATLFRNSPLLRTEPGVAVVGVKFVFHKEHFDSVKNQVIISDAIQQSTGTRLRVTAEIIQKEQSAIAGESGGIGDVLAVFGGELVE